MPWWTGRNIEPKRKSRFVVEIANGFFLPNVKTCTKPSANVDLKEFQLINHKFKYPGVVTWQDIKITMVDMNGNSGANQSLDTALLLWRMLKHTGYNIPTEAIGPIAAFGPNRQLSTPEKASSISNGFGSGIYSKNNTFPAGVGQSSNAQSVKIYTLDPEGNTVETWILHNPQIKSVSWGDHSYDSDEFVEYSLDISYDFAHHEKGRKLKIGKDLYSTPDINTPVTIGTKYNQFISFLQSGKAFSEANAYTQALKDNEQYEKDNPVEDFSLNSLSPGERFLAQTGRKGNYSVTYDLAGVPVYSTTTLGEDFSMGGPSAQDKFEDYVQREFRRYSHDRKNERIREEQKDSLLDLYQTYGLQKE